jgi:3-oxoadipate enol-lactonase
MWGLEMPRIVRDSQSIYFEVDGSGPPVVLGHSFLCSGKMWAPQLPALVERNTVINVDLRGHGRSGQIHGAFDLYDLVEDVTAVLDHLGVGRAVWAGLSIGGMVALRAASRARDRVAGLILLDTDAGAESMINRVKYGAMAQASRIFGNGPFVPEIARMFFCSRTRTTNPGLVREWKNVFLSVPSTTISHTVKALGSRDSVVGQLAAVTVPALVMVGEFDKPTPPTCSREIAGALPSATLLEVENAGHLSNLERPDVVTSAMIANLRGWHW